MTRLGEVRRGEARSGEAGPGVARQGEDLDDLAHQIKALRHRVDALEADLHRLYKDAREAPSPRSSGGRRGEVPTVPFA